MLFVEFISLSINSFRTLNCSSWFSLSSEVATSRYLLLLPQLTYCFSCITRSQLSETCYRFVLLVILIPSNWCLRRPLFCDDNIHPTSYPTDGWWAFPGNASSVHVTDVSHIAFSASDLPLYVSVWATAEINMAAIYFCPQKANNARPQAQASCWWKLRIWPI